MRQIAEIVREILGIAPGTRDRRVSAILVSVIKSEAKLSYWGLIKHFDLHPDDLERCELIQAVLQSMVPAPHIGDRSRSTAEDHHRDGRR